MDVCFLFSLGFMFCYLWEKDALISPLAQSLSGILTSLGRQLISIENVPGTVLIIIMKITANNI